MKKLLALLLLAGGCSAPASPAQSAVEAYLKKTLDDPASYQPVRWGKATPWRQSDDDTTAATKRMPAWASAARAYEIQFDSVELLARAGADTDIFNVYRHKAEVRAMKADSLSAIILKLKASKDTALLGQSIRHTFRTKNKLGGLVLDSARFVVSAKGAVSVLP